MLTPDLFQGPIAREYGRLAASDHGHKDKPPTSTGDSCGSDCTNPLDCAQSSKIEGSCPVIPGREKKKYKAFAPVVSGWSEPPSVGA